MLFAKLRTLEKNPGLLQPLICKINFVRSKHNHILNMKLIYVNMQHYIT